MARCPSCGEDGIRPLAKFWSGSAEPTSCERCGRLVYVPTFATNNPSLLLCIACAASVALCFYLASPWPMSLLLLASLAWWVWFIRFTPMRVADPSEVTFRGRSGNVFLAILAAAMVTALVVGRALGN